MPSYWWPREEAVTTKVYREWYDDTNGGETDEVLISAIGQIMASFGHNGGKQTSKITARYSRL